MSQPSIPVQFYEWEQEEYPFQILSHSTRMWFSRQLDPQRDSFSPIHRRLQDWRGVAEMLDFGSLDIDNFQRSPYPTLEVLRQWSIKPEATIGALLRSIMDIERFDILCDPELVAIVGRDISDYKQKEMVKASRNQNANPVQVPEVESSDTPDDEFLNITVNEAATGVPEEFDAFVCYTRQDFDFVRDMLHRLETVHGLKLCIPDRDLMPGAATYVIMAKLIKERCRKMIIVLSPDYTNSDECRFQTLFAHSLAPGAQQKKLIPILYRQCAIPSILNYICLVDYTRCDVVDWFWQRLANSLRADRRSNNLNPFPMVQMGIPINRNPTGSGEVFRNDSRSSLTSTQPVACSSGMMSSSGVTPSSGMTSLVVEQRSYSNPALASSIGSRDGFTTSSNLVFPENWDTETRDKTASNQSIDGDFNIISSFEMESMRSDNDMTSFIDNGSSKTEPIGIDSNKKQTTTKSLFSSFPFSKKSKKN